MKNPALITAIASILVAVVAALSARASQRAAAKASTNTSRLDMEREAYERAREYDTETIKRQAAEIEDLRSQLREQHSEIEDLQARNRDLNTRVFLLERGVGPITINYKEGFDDDDSAGELPGLPG